MFCILQAQIGQNQRMEAALENVLSNLSVNSGKTTSTSLESGNSQTTAEGSNSALSKPSPLVALLAGMNSQDVSQNVSQNVSQSVSQLLSSFTHKQNGDSHNGILTNGDLSDSHANDSSVHSVLHSLLSPKHASDNEANMADLKIYLETFVKQEIQHSEQRLLSNVERIVSQSEKRIMTKIDLVLEKIGTP